MLVQSNSICFAEQTHRLYRPPWWVQVTQGSTPLDGSISPSPVVAAPRHEGRAAGSSEDASVGGANPMKRRRVAAPATPAMRPFRKAFRGVTWNAQALFSPDPDLSTAKQQVMERLARTHDFVMLQETHSTPGALAAWRPPSGYAYFHSHGNSTVGGVGILVDERFLQQFDLPVSEQLEEVVPGRVGALRLRGPAGRLDLFVVYAATGDAKQERWDMRQQLSGALIPPHQALSVVAGDWNYAAMTEDRFSASPLAWTGARDSSEEDHFQSVLGSPFELIEFEQHEFTNHSGTGRAKLDRAYANFGVDAQLDHLVSCVALPRPGKTSTHRPVSFRLVPPQRHTGQAAPLPESIVRTEEWATRVRLRHAEFLQQEVGTAPPSGNRSLVLLKRAMRAVAETMQAERGQQAKAADSDRLSILIRLLRAWDQGRVGAVRRLAVQWDLGQDLTIVKQWSEAGEQRIGRLRKEAMELARAAYVQDLRSHQSQAAEMPAAQHAQRRVQLMTKLKRLRPGASTTLQAVMDEAGHVQQEPEDMAKALCRHWSKVFAEQPAHADDIAAWLESAYPAGDGLEGMPSTNDKAWKLRRRDVARAVKLSGRSSPGPDGIPYAAWRSLGPNGVDALWSALRELGQENGIEQLEAAYHDSAGCDFNMGLLACIPKATTGTTAAGQAYVSPADTRPISMVDTSNRIMANAARLRWEGNLGAWICNEQRGFLPHRSMLANVIGLEHEAMRTSLLQSEGGLLLLDFAAAFPSISQRFIKAVLHHLGLPPAALRFVDALYHKTACQVQVKGVAFDGFEMRSGIRQGCPLSPLLFVTAMDGLLRIILREVSGSSVKAFADDTAVVFRSLKEDLPKLHNIFNRLARASNLRLNMKKCVLIPLGDRGPNAVKAYLERSGSPWFGTSVCTHGRYLGFEIGPGRETLSWAKPMQKARTRVGMWEWSRLGLFYSTQVWNIMIISLFAFVAQLERPPPAVLALETALLRKAAPGVGGWCRQAELHHLQRAYGFAGEYKAIAHTVRAAQLRVARYENIQHGGLQLRQREEELRVARRDTIYIDREFRWRAWMDAAHCIVLLANERELRRQGVRISAVEEEAAGSAPRPWTLAVLAKVRRNFQKAAGALIRRDDGYDALDWIRSKLAYWGVRDRREAVRCLCRIRELQATVPPRVFAAALGCIWNKWPTARRKQVRGRPCLLGCGHGEDSVQHYSGCPQVRQAARKWLGMEFRISHPLLHWVCAAPTCVEIEETLHWWSRVALLQYAVQQVTNGVRHGRGPLPASEEAQRALRQGLLEGVRGHSMARSLLRPLQQVSS